MAVPKKRTGHSAQGKRRANWKATKPETTKCPTCGETVLTHTVCTACGTYKGQPVRLADKAAAVAAAEPAKKATKKSTKKAAPKAEETKVEEVKEEVVEEVKAEEATEEKTEE
ncbi:50S ribosomal protein L32 [bacterium]|nr:50S ribosomal protein L32 [bacterium]